MSDLDRQSEMNTEVTALIARLEVDPAKRGEYEFYSAFHGMRRRLEEGGDIPPHELIAEDVAFSIHAQDHQPPSAWDLYFGPLASGTTEEGEPWDVPPLSDITPEVMAYWRKRAGESSHPVLRARYADLLWEMPQKLRDVKRDPSMARIAIDAYIIAVQQGRYEHDVTAIAKGKRAIEIALSLNDSALVERARDTLLSLEEKVAQDESLGLWGFCFDLFVEPPNKRVFLTDDQRKKLIDDIEARLQRLAAQPPGQHHPMAIEAAAVRLANYYRRVGRGDDLSRVLLMYGSRIREMHGTAAPLVVAHSLERLYELFKSFGLHKEADSLNQLMRAVGEETLTHMKKVSAQAEISDEKITEYFASMLNGTATDVLQRIATHFIPKREQLETQLRDLAEKAPLVFSMPMALKNEEGRTIAEVGPLESDFEGQFVHHVAQNMQMSTWWLRETMMRAISGGVLSKDIVLTFLFDGVLYDDTRRPILEKGLEAYFQSDSMTAIHLLIPQVEQAIRQLVILMQAPIYTQRRGGGFHVRIMDDLLRDEGLTKSLTENVMTYFRILFTDARGWNLRNDVCHGIASVAMLSSMAAADRVLHALLVLALVRRSN